MVEKDAREELQNAYNKHLIMEKNIDQALSFLLRLNPLEVIAPKLEGKAELTGDVRGKLQMLTQMWIDIYSDTLREGKDISRDLIGRAAEIAKELREKKEGFTKPSVPTEPKA
jgi:hypothetical protein